MNPSSRYSAMLGVLRGILLGVLGAVLGTAAALAAAPAAAAAKADPVRRTLVEVSVPHVSAPVRVEGQFVLVYEVHLANLASTSLRLKRVDVRTDGGRSMRTRVGEQAIRQRLALIGEPAGKDVEIPAGRQAILYLEVEAGASAPRRVQHDIYVESGDAKGAITRIIDAGVTDVGVDVPLPPALSLGPPLRGGPWVAVYSPAWPRGHRRVFYPGMERDVLPGRFAIDWVRADADGHIARADANRAADHLGYGEPVLAVAAGRIAAVRDDVPEPEKLSDADVHAPGESAGNYVALDLLNGHFAIYEHLRPGSITVQVGDGVREGDAIAQLGFTGDSTGPHLHLHVAQAPLPLVTEGVAYHFRQFTRLGQYEDVAQLGQRGWTPAQSARVTSARGVVRERELPAPNAVVMFPER